jgi:hypothetical protein
MYLYMESSPLASKCSPESQNLLPLGLRKHVDLRLRKLHDSSHQSIRILGSRRGRSSRSAVGLSRRLIWHTGDWRSVTRSGVARHWGGRIGSSRWRCSGLDDRLNSFGGDETHEKKSLKHCIRQLWCLLEKLGSSLRFVGREGLHLGKNVE